MWFSGLRGAIAYALALHLEFEEEKRRVVVTTTLIIVLFTIIILGGSTMPVMKVRNFFLQFQSTLTLNLLIFIQFMKAEKKVRGRRRGGKRSTRRAITLSKTKEMVII